MYKFTREVQESRLWLTMNLLAPSLALLVLSVLPTPPAPVFISQELTYCVRQNANPILCWVLCPLPLVLLFTVIPSRTPKMASPLLIVRGISRKWSRICRRQSRTYGNRRAFLPLSCCFRPKPKQQRKSNQSVVLFVHLVSFENIWHNTIQNDMI